MKIETNGEVIPCRSTEDASDTHGAIKANREKSNRGVRKLNRDRVDKIIAIIRAGNHKSAAAKYVGITPNTLNNWLKAGGNQEQGLLHDLYVGVEQALAESEMRAVRTVSKAFEDGDWKAAMAYLERRFPDVWAKRNRTELSGPDGSPVEFRGDIMHSLMKEAEGGFAPEVVDEDLPCVELSEPGEGDGTDGTEGSDDISDEAGD